MTTTPRYIRVNGQVYCLVKADPEIKKVAANIQEQITNIQNGLRFTKKYIIEPALEIQVRVNNMLEWLTFHKEKGNVGIDHVDAFVNKYEKEFKALSAAFAQIAKQYVDLINKTNRDIHFLQGGG